MNTYHSIFNKEEHDNICNMCRNAAVGCITCKKTIGDKINRLLDPIREKRKFFENKPETIQEILQSGNNRARLEGAKTMVNIREAMNMNYFSEH